MQTVERLNEEALRAYLPQTLIHRWHRRPGQPPVWGHWLSGSLMHCDISGFTAMSESLGLLGKEGAELMASVLNRFFHRMLEVADRWDGVQMKFGGDAMLLFFSGRQHAEHAAACALEMQATMAEFRRLSVGGQSYRLRMRIGIHSGRFFSASVGQPDRVLHYMLMGPDVNRVASVEAAAQPGQVVTSAETAALLGSRCQLLATAAGVWRLRGVELGERPQRKPDSCSVLSGVLRRYLLPPLAESLAEGRVPSLPGEHRRVTTLFINLLGASHLLESRGGSEALAQVDAYLKKVISALERHGGFLASSDVGEEGDKLIALFGAPVSNEREEASALRCALDLERELVASGLELHQRIGINSGYVFAGEIGSSQRREYTVIGDSVNLAARLMAAARPGKTLVSGATAKRAGAEFDLRRLRPIRVKGKSAPVQVHRLEGARLAPKPLEAEGAFPTFGRDADLAALLKLSRRVGPGRGRWAYIWGEAGIGKSRLVADFAVRLRSQGWLELAGFCQAHTSRTPFAALAELLRARFEIGAGDSPQDARRKLKAEIGRLRPDLEAAAALVGEMLGLGLDEEPLLSALDAKARRRLLTSAVVEILHESARERPLLLLIEDVHWADGPSLELLAAVLGRLDGPLLVCLTSRQDQPPRELSGSRPSLSLHLQALPAEDARRLVASSARLADHEVEAIVARAQGNPLFLQELARTGEALQDALPETVNDVIMARLDRLADEEKIVLRLASVIGPTFPLDALGALLAGRVMPLGLEQTLTDLTQRGFTRALEGGPPAYAFSHALTREVVYQTLPYARRRELHHAVADRIEMERADQLESVCGLLLHHYELSGDPAKTVLYGSMSGDRAAAVFANREAADYYRRSLAALERGPKKIRADRSLLLERLGDCLETAGHHSDAAGAFVEALNHWREAGRRPRPRLMPWAGDGGVREADLCRKVAVSYERRSDYDESLHWLDEALALLPRRAGRFRAQVCAAKCVSLLRKGLYAEGIVWGRRALQLARRCGDRGQMAYAHNMLATAYGEQGALRGSLRHLRPAVRLYHELGDFAGQASANNNLGACYQQLGILDGALYHYRVALQADKRVGDIVDVAIVHNNIGEVLLALGEIEEAVGHLDEVLRASEVRADVAGLAHINISRCRLAQGDIGAAEEHLRRALRLLRGLGAHGLLIEADLQLAELRLAQGRAEEARQECRRALRRARALDAKLLEARGERLLGRAQAARGEREAALANLRDSIALARRIGADHEQALSLLALARVCLDFGAASQWRIRALLRRAASILGGMGAASNLAEARTLLERTGQ